MENSPGKRIRMARETLGWTQAVVAEKLGIRIGTLSGYERNYRQPNLEMLGKLATVLGVSTDYILGLTNIPEPYTCNEKNNKHTKTVYNIIPQPEGSVMAQEMANQISQRQDLLELAQLLVNYFCQLDPEIVPKLTEVIKLIKKSHRS